MRVTTIDTPGLGDRSYVIDDGSTAVVIDPQRDIDRIRTHLEDNGLSLGLVCETHVHNDYLTGGLALSRLTGADYVLNAADDLSFPYRGVRDGEEISLGDLTVRVLSAPGHTPTHLAYHVLGAGSAGVFTGGSMLYGTVGRTDLLGADLTEELSRQQHRSVRRMTGTLETDTAVYPTHGFGSFCASAGGGSRTSGTIEDEQRENIALEHDEDEFVATLMDGFTAHPPYYAHMGLLNRAGPHLPDLTLPDQASAADLGARIRSGEWVVDLRSREDFAASHAPGTVNVDVEGSFATYLGWALPWGTPVALVGDSEEKVRTAQRELVRIGIDRPSAVATRTPAEYADGDPESYPTRSFADLADAQDAQVVDVRRDDEWADGHLDGAIHLRLEEVALRADELPETTLWVHCASGFRASIAASLIARTGRDVVLIDDMFDNVADAGIKVVEDGGGAG